MDEDRERIRSVLSADKWSWEKALCLLLDMGEKVESEIMQTARSRGLLQEMLEASREQNANMWYAWRLEQLDLALQVRGMAPGFSVREADTSHVELDHLAGGTVTNMVVRGIMLPGRSHMIGNRRRAGWALLKIAHDLRPACWLRGIEGNAAEIANMVDLEYIPTAGSWRVLDSREMLAQQEYEQEVMRWRTPYEHHLASPLASEP